MKIKFTHDFQGKLTNEQFYLAGTEIDIDEDVGKELIALHHAVVVEVVDEPEVTQSIAVHSSRAELFSLAQERGVEIKPRASRKTIITALLEAQKAVEAAEQPVITPGQFDPPPEPKAKPLVEKAANDGD